MRTMPTPPAAKRKLRTPVHSWQFSRRFRRGGFGWRSAPAVEAVRAAVSEIRSVARREPLLGAEGAARLIERVGPALERVDSSSGSIGTAVYAALGECAKIVGEAPLLAADRSLLLERLWTARLDDGMGYLDHMDDLWGTFCGSAEAASAWADEYVPYYRQFLDSRSNGYYVGATACLSALFAAGRDEELLALVARLERRSWFEGVWVFKSLARQGRMAEALRHAEHSRGLNDFGIDAACEELLLSHGFAEEAYRRYGMAAAPHHSTNLATFRAMRKKYPNVAPARLILDLAAVDPGREGRWFAAAMSAGLRDVALQLARTSPADPKTLTRAAKAAEHDDPVFAQTVAELALKAIAAGHGYELTSLDATAAFTVGQRAAEQLGTTQQYFEYVRAIAANDQFLAQSLNFVLGTAAPTVATRRVK
jgi:hypothetical protein